MLKARRCFKDKKVMQIDQFELKKHIRTIADWPIKGINFKDLSPLFASPKAMHQCIAVLTDKYIDAGITHIAAIEARGFILGAMLAQSLNLPLIMIRKGNKLPGKVISEPFKMEYGERILEMHEGICGKGDKVLIFDDLLATGGSILAASTLIKRQGADIVDIATVINLAQLGGEQLLTAAGMMPFSLISY